MSVYKRPGAETYSYDFQLGGRRFSGTTGAASKREAERAETRARTAAREELSRTSDAPRAPLTVKDACARYWDEVGQHLKGGGDDNCLWSLVWIERELGPGRRLLDIDDECVARLVARRRGERALLGRRDPKGEKDKPPRLVANATVNRSVTEPLRKVMNRAARVWREPVPEISWRDHMLREPKERVRELRADEEARLFEVLREDFHPIVRFALLTGVRLGEVLRLTWDDVDWGGRLIWIRGKGGKLATIPLPPAVRDLLFPLQEHRAVLEEVGDTSGAVWTYVVARGRAKGQRRPITREGLKSAFRRVRLEAGLVDYRWHDHRHTTATRVLRRTGNLRLVQELLRHENVTTTTKYAHVTHADVLAAMQATAEAAKPVEPVAPASTDAAREA